MSRALAVLVCAAILALPAPSRSANFDLQGILSWSDCGSPPDTVETFACDSNNGTSRLVVSFISPAATEPVQLVTGVFDVWPASPAGSVPDWWAIGACRPMSPFRDVNVWTSGATACPSLYAGQITWGIQSNPYAPGYRIRVDVFCDPPVVFPGGTESFAFGLDITHRHTIGTNACGGCDRPVGLNLRFLELRDTTGVLASALRDHGPWAGWQCPGNPIPNVSFGWDGWAAEPACFAASPTRPATWGRIKALYR